MVKNAPAYSGFKRRKYAIKNPDIEQIEVEAKTLDEVIGENQKIDFIKIDVEGAEMEVLEGAKIIILKNKPLVLFECGIGASDYYNTKAEDVFHYFKSMDMNIFTLKDYLKYEGKKSLTVDDFCNHFKFNKEYYFLAV